MRGGAPAAMPRTRAAGRCRRRRCKECRRRCSGTPLFAAAQDPETPWNATCHRARTAGAGRSPAGHRRAKRRHAPRAERTFRTVRGERYAVGLQAEIETGHSPDRRPKLGQDRQEPPCARQQWLTAVQDHRDTGQAMALGVLGDPGRRQPRDGEIHPYRLPSPSLLRVLVDVAVIASKIATARHLEDVLADEPGIRLARHSHPGTQIPELNITLLGRCQRSKPINDRTGSTCTAWRKRDDRTFLISLAA